MNASQMALLLLLAEMVAKLADDNGWSIDADDLRALAARVDAEIERLP